MEILIFGNSRSPAIDFTLDPVDGLKVNSRECYCLDYSGVGGTLTWKDFYFRVTPNLQSRKGMDLDDMLQSVRNPISQWSTVELIELITEPLLKCTSALAERTFLERYIEIVSDAPLAALDGIPALVPQTWVNWWHYHPDNSERAKILKKQPLRVDFVAFYEGRKIVIEIDGWSHISDNYLSVDSKGHPAERPSLIKYTEHLKKDRWLRRQGWEVYRFSNIEVEEEGAGFLLNEIGIEWIPF